ncbi:hypothetical protein BD779DRAFT_142722 [Infundibulicybe gibba]|nr:hypothetical protein BD779DRAFT_142722 [Infundibulicybe gibba]
MYRLADKLGIPELQMLALDGIRSSLSVRNILTEVFSRYTSMYTEVQKMESGVFIGLFPSLSDDEFDRARTQLVEGDLPHSSDALGVIIRELMKRIESSKRFLPEAFQTAFEKQLYEDSTDYHRRSPVNAPAPSSHSPHSINVSRTPSPPLVSIVAPQPTIIQRPRSWCHQRALALPTHPDCLRNQPLGKHSGYHHWSLRLKPLQIQLYLQTTSQT